MMRKVRSLFRLWLALALSLAPVAAYADDTPDPCQETACEVNCGVNTPCIVQLGLDTFAHTARAMNRGSQLSRGAETPLLCVQSGTSVKWVPANATSYYAVTFNSKHTPFSQSLFLGNAKHPFFGTVSNHGSTNRCYVYSFVVCNKSGVCQHADPKVIIKDPP